MKSCRIITIQQVDDIIITVYDVKGQNHLEFEIPKSYTGEKFDAWWKRNKEVIYKI